MQPKTKLDIPTPRIVTVDTYEKEMPPTYHPPKSYIRYTKSSKQQQDNEMEYVADAEDEVWLHNNTKFGGSARTPDGRRRPQVTVTMMEQMLDLLEKATGFETIITTDQAERLVFSKIPQFTHMFPYKAPAGVVTSKHVVGDIYNYWVQKRSKLKRPLLRRFWPVTASDDTNPHLVFRPREKEKYKLRKKRQNDMESLRKLKQLRNDFQKVRVLLDLVKRREELNRCTIQLQEEWFEQRMSDVIDTSGKPRHSPNLRRDEVERLLDTPRYFNIKGGSGNRKKKRKRGSGWEETLELSPVPRSNFDLEMTDAKPSASAQPHAPLGRRHREPGPAAPGRRPGQAGAVRLTPVRLRTGALLLGLRGVGRALHRRWPLRAVRGGRQAPAPARGRVPRHRRRDPPRRRRVRGHVAADRRARGQRW